ncbi:transposase [Fructilactobacillus hinvesii]|uniref:transposase n=1 Tax=Fructilactobacillus hinvesii TaxID=2940300 RepID=UPI003083FFA5
MRTKFKIKVVEFYLNNPVSSRETARKFNIKSNTNLLQWIEIYKSEGPLGLKVNRSHKIYSREFKLSVVNYYKTHETSIRLTALEFKLNQSQVQNWIYQFNHFGAEALLPKRHGRPSMKKKYKDSPLSQDKESAYLDEISKLKAQINENQMEIDILKKHLASEYGIKIGQNDNWKHRS